MARVTVMGRVYETCRETDVPSGLRWDTPQRHQGQAIEVQYGVPQQERSEADVGDAWRRVIDRSVGPGAITYYRLVGRE